MVYTMIYIMIYFIVYIIIYMHVYALLIYTVISGARSHELWRNTGICHWAKIQRQTCARYSKFICCRPNDTRQCCCRAIGFCLVMMLKLQSGSHTSIASHSAAPLWKQGWSYCRFHSGDKQRKQALWAQQLDVALWAGAALQGQAEQRHRERLTEARKSTAALQTMKRLREELCTRGAAGDKDAVGDEWRRDVMVYMYICIIQYTMIYTNDIYCGMSCITYGI
jgi:hypothetical protein